MSQEAFTAYVKTCRDLLKHTGNTEHPEDTLAPRDLALLWADARIKELVERLLIPIKKLRCTRCETDGVCTCTPVSYCKICSQWTEGSQCASAGPTVEKCDRQIIACRNG